MSTNIEQVAVAKVVYGGDLLPFINGGIKAEFFTSKRWSQAWTWVYDYWTSYSEVPALSAFTRQFPSWEFPDTDEPSEAIVGELIKRRRQILLEEGLAGAVDFMQKEETDDSVSALRTMLAGMDIETSKTMVVDSNDIIGGIIIRAKDRDGSTLIGIPTGFPTIDAATGGLQPEQLITITALPKAGKSTVELVMAMAAQEYGARVGLVSFEMRHEEEMHRYISLGSQVPLSVLTRGRVPTEKEIERMEAFEQHVIDDLPGITIIHDIAATMTVGAIAARIREYEFDALFIDGTYMMEDEHGEPPGSPRALTNITRALKRLCQTAKIPIVQTTQSLIAKTSKRTGVSMGSIGYTSSFAQDSDALIGLDREDLSMPTATLKIIAARNAIGVEVALRFDYGEGICEESGGFVHVGPRMGGMIEDGD